MAAIPTERPARKARPLLGLGLLDMMAFLGPPPWRPLLIVSVICATT
jgi:hypothetical protein